MIYAAILDNSEKPIMQIIPQDDWNASYDSMGGKAGKTLLHGAWKAFKRTI